MNIKTTILAITMIAFAGSASATTKTPPTPPVKPEVAKAATQSSKTTKKPLNESCKIIKGKQKCHKSPYKSKIQVQPYQGKPAPVKKTK